eukprot:281410-Pyramimonas_sp.AAC.1
MPAARTTPINAAPTRGNAGVATLTCDSAPAGGLRGGAAGVPDAGNGVSEREDQADGPLRGA